MNQKTRTIEALLPVKIKRGNIRYAQGVKAGNWIFATGHMATDYKQGLPPQVLDPRFPLSGKPKNEKEADLIFGKLDKVLRAGGSNLSNVVRLDQYYTSSAAVDHYHVARRAALGTYIPPSTSILESGLLLRDADIEVEMIAIIPTADTQVEIFRPPQIDSPKTSGYAPAVKVGDFIFVAGQLATAGKGEEEPIPPEARTPRGYLWRGGTQIKLETEYIVRHRLEPALKASGSSLQNVVKAQVYLRNVADIPAFNRVWASHFPIHPPVTTVVPTSTPGFGIVDANIEINAIALADDGRTKREIFNPPISTEYENQTVAIRAGNLLFITGLMAVDKNGLIAGSLPDPQQPFFGTPVQSQMDHILRTARKICRGAGTSLDNVLRIQQFHTHLEEFYPAYQVFQSYLPGCYLPFSAIQVPGPLPVPGATLLVDLWVYAP
jgi:enamine deaminase RidA (YjgF/YER057c/UK114 family)